MKKLCGIDFGTGGCKTTVIDLNGEILASSFQEYPSIHEHPGWSEQDPALWIDALRSTVKACAEQMNDGFEGVLGVAVTASTHNAVLLDKDSNVIRNCIMWNDQRSGKQSEELKEAHGELIYRIGMAMPAPTWTISQLLWVKQNEPEKYKQINRIYFTKDYVRSYLTGDFVTDVVDAQGSLLYDAVKREWSKELCDLIDLPLSVLPEIRDSDEVVGTVKAEVAKELGLPEGLPVLAGCSDTAAEDLSAGAVNEGQIIIKLATAGNVNIVMDNAKPHPKSFTYPYSVKNKWYTVTATNSCASAYRWMRDAIFDLEKESCEAAGEDVYILMDKLAAEAELGAGGMIFHPYLLGERCPYFTPEFRANFFGVNMMHKKEHFARALLEGVAFSLYDCAQVIKEFTDNLSDICIIGGGAKSPLWCQIVSDVFGLEVKYPAKAESSFGGALLVGIGLGEFKDAQEAVEKCVSMKKVFKPNPENHRKYQEIFSVYQVIVKALSPIWNKAAKLAKEN